jgi:hypothetical protein
MRRVVKVLRGEVRVVERYGGKLVIFIQHGAFLVRERVDIL